MSAPACPIYTVGDGTRTQMARRSDGVWFKRVKDLHGHWMAWDECRMCPYPFGKYIDRKAGNARLPNAAI